MPREKSYAGVDNADEMAVQDIRDYLGEERWSLFLRLVMVEMDKEGFDFQAVNISLGFAGVTGFPVHAFGRLYMPIHYEKWKGE